MIVRFIALFSSAIFSLSPTTPKSYHKVRFVSRLFLFESTEFLRQKDENFHEVWPFRAISCRLTQRNLLLKLKMAAL